MSIENLLSNIPLPQMIPVRQHFVGAEIADIAGTLQAELRKPIISEKLRKGMRIAIAVGSRGLAQLPVLVETVVSEIKRKEGSPFIIPAMGSHGGATGAGQKEVLESLGITETTMGCPIISSMEVVPLGSLDSGMAVFIDKQAFAADGIVIINRIKPHTGFSGAHESGLLKMITVGLGKQHGASACHLAGRKQMSQNIEDAAKLSLQKAPILFGIATVENAYDKIMKVSAIPAEQLVATDKTLLLEAKANMPRILLQPINVLIIDQMGKEFSGAGIDPHVTGRASWPSVLVGPEPNRIVVLDISEKSHGNAVGMGIADVSTKRLFDKIDFDVCYTNALTAGGTQGVRIPMIMASDKLAIQAAMRTCAVSKPEQIRVVRIANTLHIENIQISANLLTEAKDNPLLSIMGDAVDFAFDTKGNLL